MSCFGGDYLRTQLADKDAEFAALRAQLEKAKDAWNALPRQPQDNARLQAIAATISGILDRYATADQCMATIERHVARTGEKVRELVAENSALMLELDALKARLGGTVYDGTDATLPPKLSWLCIHNNEYGVRMVARHLHAGGGKCREESRHIYQLQVGDSWVLWPTMGGGE